MKKLPNICHNYRTEGFQIPIKPFLFENLDLFGNPVVTLQLKQLKKIIPKVLKIGIFLSPAVTLVPTKAFRLHSKRKREISIFYVQKIKSWRGDIKPYLRKHIGSNSILDMQLLTKFPLSIIDVTSVILRIDE